MNEIHLVFWLRGFADCIQANERKIPSEKEWDEINKQITETMCWILERPEKCT